MLFTYVTQFYSGLSCEGSSKIRLPHLSSRRSFRSCFCPFALDLIGLTYHPSSFLQLSGPRTERKTNELGLQGLANRTLLWRCFFSRNICAGSLWAASALLWQQGGLKQPWNRWCLRSCHLRAQLQLKISSVLISKIQPIGCFISKREFSPCCFLAGNKKVIPDLLPPLLEK